MPAIKSLGEMSQYLITKKALFYLKTWFILTMNFSYSKYEN